jgi:hypothetical protein
MLIFRKGEKNNRKQKENLVFIGIEDFFICFRNVGYMFFVGHIFFVFRGEIKGDFEIGVGERMSYKWKYANL